MTAALSIAEILDQPALVPLWPIVGQALGQAESTTYQLAARDELPFELVRLGRRRYVRHVDLLAFLHLPTNSDAARGPALTASSEHVNETAAKRIGTSS